MEAYAGRTELSRDGLSAGSLDLRITGLRPSDDGRYVCTVEDADAYNEAIVDLEVSVWILWWMMRVELARKLFSQYEHWWLLRCLLSDLLAMKRFPHSGHS
ncbi:Butyrophilin subfamily 3 member A3 [Aix galericulata]|nr:Butyrophilin subfamily 3 member A3 [Aix galericulata]